MYHTLRDDCAFELETQADRLDELRAIAATDVEQPPTVQRPIVCRVGLVKAGVFIESPKTRRRVELPRTALPETRIVGRITQNVSVGTLRIEFTRGELLAVKSFIDAELERSRSIELRVATVQGSGTVQLTDPELRFYLIGAIELATQPKSLNVRLYGDNAHQVRVTPAEWEAMTQAIIATRKRTAYDSFRDRLNGRRTAFRGIH